VRAIPPLLDGEEGFDRVGSVYGSFCGTEKPDPSPLESRSRTSESSPFRGSVLTFLAETPYSFELEIPVKMVVCHLFLAPRSSHSGPRTLGTCWLLSMGSFL